MSGSSPYAIDFAPAARRGLARLPLSAAAALHEHLTGPVAGNPHRLGKPLEAPCDDVWTTRRGDYRALYSIDDRRQPSLSWRLTTAVPPASHGDVQPHPAAVSGPIRCPARWRDARCGPWNGGPMSRWRGWGSNPRPAAYESRRPASLVR